MLENMQDFGSKCEHDNERKKERPQARGTTGEESHYDYMTVNSAFSNYMRDEGLEDGDSSHRMSSARSLSVGYCQGQASV